MRSFRGLVLAAWLAAIPGSAVSMTFVFDSKPPSPGPAEIRQPPEAQAEPNQQQPATSEKVPPSTRPVVGGNGPAREGGSADSENDGDDKAASDWWLVRLTGGLVLVGLAQALLFVWQLDLIRKGLNDAKETADAAKVSAEAAKASVVLAQKAYEESERPYVFPASIGQIHIFDPTGPLIPQVRFDIVNYGTRPALIWRVHGKFMLLSALTPEALEAPNIGDGIETISGGDVAATLAEDDRHPIVLTLPFEQEFRLEAYGGFGRPRSDSSRQLYLRLIIEYRDVFQRLRTGRSLWRFEHISHRFVSHGGKQYNYETAEP